MSTFPIPFTAVLLTLEAVGVYSLQARLERWDHNRHLND
jgi:hypothetical protein